MEDVVGSRGYNPVRHFQIRSSVSGLVNYTNIDGASIEIIDYPLPFIIDNDTLNGIAPLVSSALLNEWSIEAFNAFHDQVPPQVLLPNFLYELRDIKGMIPKIERSIAKTASSNFLAYNFGIAPFIGDVKKLTGLVESVNKRLNHLRKTAGKPIHLKFKRKLPDLGDLVFERELGNGAEIGAHLVYELAGYQGEFVASATLVQNLDIPDVPLTQLKALASAAGALNPTAVVWEAIPYSFVVDWFFQVGPLIDSMNIQPFGGEYSLSDVGYSLNESFSYRVYQHFYPERGNEKIFLGTISVRRYKRRLGLPVFSLFLTDGILSPKQLMLATALLDQRRH